MKRVGFPTGRIERLVRPVDTPLGKQDLRWLATYIANVPHGLPPGDENNYGTLEKRRFFLGRGKLTLTPEDEIRLARRRIAVMLDRILGMASPPSPYWYTRRRLRPPFYTLPRKPSSLIVPLAWLAGLRQPYGKHSAQRTSYEAVLVLAFIVSEYRQRRRRADLIPRFKKEQWIGQRLSLNKEAVGRALRLLEKEGYIRRLIIRGFVPWPKASGHRYKRGSYLFILPIVPKIAALSRPIYVQRRGRH